MSSLPAGAKVSCATVLPTRTKPTSNRTVSYSETSVSSCQVDASNPLAGTAVRPGRGTWVARSRSSQAANRPRTSSRNRSAAREVRKTP